MSGRKIAALGTLLLLVLSVVQPAAGQALTGYFEDGSITFEGRTDRSLGVIEQNTYFNNSWATIQLTITKTIPSDKVENLKVWDGSGNISFTTSVSNGNTILTFQTRNISGKGRYTYSISYDVGGAVRGSAYEYLIPAWGFTAEARYNRYSVTVKGPAETYPFLSMENAVLISTDPPTWQYTTSLEKGEKIPSFQSRFYVSPAPYRLKMRIPIYGPASGSATGVVLDLVVLTDEIPSQFSSVISSNYQPNGAYFDADNNLHLIFKIGEIAAGEVKEVEVDLLCEVKVHDQGIRPENVGGFLEIPRNLENYTVPGEGWESDNPLIFQMAKNLVAGETNVYNAAKKIHEYVVERLEYEIQDVRRGALWAFSNRRGDCSEYTDLSIALARIPARAIYGWGYSGEDNLVEHAWPEFYLPGVGWQPSDPTWAETTGDYFTRSETVHIARNIRGVISGEATSKMTFYGASPEFGKSQNSVYPIISSEIKQAHIAAAEYCLKIAENLFTVENEVLAEKLQLAKSELEAAKRAENTAESISRARNSISCSKEIIRVLGKPYAEKGFAIPQELLLGLIAILVVVGIGVGIAKLRTRKEEDFH
ncbi:MAG: transglutaminase-like domain-containing protein [Candidatus Hadarchaeales archaeon]